MDFGVPEELRQMRATVRGFIDKEVEPLAQLIEDEDRIPTQLVEMAKELGLFGLSIPERYGGAGLNMLGRCFILEEVGRTHSGFTSLIGAHTGIGTTGIVELGDYLKDRYLPDMARGEKIGAFALTEPDAGSDASNIKTTAVKKGDIWVLNGKKHFITNGSIADVVTVIAVTDKEKGESEGLSVFLVEKDFPGFRIGTVDRKMGLRGSHTSEILLDDCEVPTANLLGEEGKGYASALRILSRGRTALGARCVGACGKLIELSGRYALQRVQFGRPIASFQAIQMMLADMATETEAAKWLVYRVAWMVDSGLPVYKETAMAKLFATEVYDRVADKAVQIHGGMGYMKDYPIERYYRDSRINRIYEGTSEIQRMIIAGRLLKEIN